MENSGNKRGHRKILACGYRQNHWDEGEGWICAGSSCKEVGGFYRRNLVGNEGLPEILNHHSEFREQH